MPDMPRREYFYCVRCRTIRAQYILQGNSICEECYNNILGIEEDADEYAF